MTPEQVSWTAGIFEGEGTIAVYRDRRSSRTSVKLVVRMNDADVVARLHALCGGRLTGPCHPPSCKNPYFQWAAHGWEASRALIEIWWPWLGQRRHDQWQRAVEREPGEWIRGPRRPYSEPCGRTRPVSGAGYQRHRRKGEPSCEACAVAARDYERSRKQ